MNKINWRDVFNLFIISVVIMGLFWLMVTYLPIAQHPKQELCRFGNITLDMDSTTAVEYINKQRLRLCEQTESQIPLKIKGDSIGYTYMTYESFYIKVKNNKVYQIWIRSKLLNDKDIVTIHDNKMFRLGNEPFKHVGKTFTFEFDGKNRYCVTKN